jgi:hypothetical protein
LQVPGSLVLYRNQPVVASPPGSAAPLSVAPLADTKVAADVVTAGPDANAEAAAPKATTHVAASHVDRHGRNHVEHDDAAICSALRRVAAP